MDDAARRRVLRAQAHDPDAFAELVRRHERSIYAFILGIVRNREDARDLTQEVWIKVARHIERLRDADDFTPWLYRIARNSSLDFLRARKARFVHFGPDASAEDGEFPELPDQHNIGPEQQALALDGRHRVWETLGRLSRDDRTVLFLREYLEFPYADVAQRLGISTNAAEVRVSRARARFRRQYAKLGGERLDCSVSPLELSVLIDLDGRQARLREVVALREHVEACPHCTARLTAMREGRTLYRDLGIFSAPATLLASIVERIHVLLSGATVGPAAVSASESAADGRSAGPLAALTGGAAAKAAALVLAVAAGTGVASHEHTSNVPGIPEAPLPVPTAQVPVKGARAGGSEAAQGGPVELNRAGNEGSSNAARGVGAYGDARTGGTSAPLPRRSPAPASAAGATAVPPLPDDLGQWVVEGVPTGALSTDPAASSATAVASSTTEPASNRGHAARGSPPETPANSRAAGVASTPGTALTDSGPVRAEDEAEVNRRNGAAVGRPGNGDGRGVAQGNGANAHAGDRAVGHTDGRGHGGGADAAGPGAGEAPGNAKQAQGAGEAPGNAEHARGAGRGRGKQ